MPRNWLTDNKTYPQLWFYLLKTGKMQKEKEKKEKQKNKESNKETRKEREKKRKRKPYIYARTPWFIRTREKTKTPN